MEVNWNRAAKHRILSLAEINDLIADSGRVATSADLLQGGKANTNYRLTLPGGGSVVLRIYQRDANVATFERAVTAHVENEVPVPRFLYLHPDNSYGLTTWLEGETIESLALQNRLVEVDLAARSIGAALGRISNYKFPAPGFLSPSLTVIAGWTSTIDGLFGYLFVCMARPLVEERAGPDLPRKIEAFAKSQEPRLRQETRTPRLVHGDFKASNLLVNRGQLTGVLDWEFSHSGTFLLDIGQLFRHADCLGPEFEAGFVQGFSEAGGVLPGGWRQLSSTIDLVSLVDFLGRESSGPAMVRDVIGLITGTVGQ